MRDCAQKHIAARHVQGDLTWAAGRSLAPRLPPLLYHRSRPAVGEGRSPVHDQLTACRAVLSVARSADTQPSRCTGTAQRSSGSPFRLGTRGRASRCTHVGGRPAGSTPGRGGGQNSTRRAGVGGIAAQCVRKRAITRWGRHTPH